jgi:hypothetical protein
MMFANRIPLPKKEKAGSTKVARCCKCRNVINAEDVRFVAHLVRGLICADCAEREMPGITSEGDLLEDYDAQTD